MPLTSIRHSDAIALAIGEVDLRAGTIGGIAITYGGTNRNGWSVQAGAFERWLARNERPAMLWSHIDSEVVGSWDSVSDDADGLRVSGSLNLKTARAREARELVTRGDVTGLSVGIVPAKNGIKIEAGKVVVVEAELLEVSLVAIPADANARIKIAASIQDRIGFERFLREAGFARAAASRMAPAAWSALHPDEHQIEKFAERVNAATAKLQRK